MAANASENADVTERLAGDVKILNKWTFIGALWGVTATVVYNCLERRPVIAGVHKHILALSIGSYFGYKLGQWQDKKYAERVYLVEEYKKRHPLLFPQGTVRKHGEIQRQFIPRW